MPLVFALVLLFAVTPGVYAGIMAVDGSAGTWTGTCVLTWRAEDLERVTRLDLRLPLLVSRQGWGWQLTAGAPSISATPNPAWQKHESGSVTMQWHHQRPQVQVEVRIPVRLTRQVMPLNATAAYPLESIAADARPFLAATPWVDPAAVRAQVQSVVAGAASAVQAVVDVAALVRGQWGFRPAQVVEDSTSVLRQGSGDISGLVHAWLAALRAAGLPARAVVGVDAGQDMVVEGGGTAWRIPGFSGLSAWVEVWLPDMGWVSVDVRGLVGWLPPGRVPLVVDVDVPSALAQAAVRWRHVAGVRVTPRFAWQAELVAPPGEDRLGLRSELPGPHLVFPAPGPRRKPLRPRKDYVHPARVWCPEPFPMGMPARYGPARALNPESMETVPQIFWRPRRILTDRLHSLAQQMRVDANASLDFVELAVWRQAGGGQMWVEIFTDTANGTSAAGSPGERVLVSRPVAARDIPTQPAWVRFAWPHNATLPAGRYWIVPQFSGALQAFWLVDPVPLGQELGLSSMLSPGSVTPFAARGWMRLCP